MRRSYIGLATGCSIGGRAFTTTCSIPSPDDQGYPSMISAVHEHSMHPLTLWYAGHDSA